MRYEYEKEPLTDINDVIQFLKQSPQNPYYDFDTDYTTNSSSYYDYLAKLKPLIKILAERIYDYDKELAKRFEEWDKRIENLPDELKRMFLEWVDDGTLARILAQLLLDDYATKEEVNGLIETLENDLNLSMVNLKNDLEKSMNDLQNDLNNSMSDLDNKIDNHINIYNKKNDHFIINVDEFTGTDHFIIQSALNKARDNGGGTVYVPSRLYQLDNELIIYSNTTLWCEDGAILKRTKDGYIIMNGERGKSYSKYNGNGNIKLINGVYDGNAQSSNVGVGSNIVFAHADNIVIENVTVKNSNSHHIEINSSKNVTINNCKLIGGLASLTFQEAIQLDLSTRGGFSAFGDYDNTPCENIYITNNYFGDSKELPSVLRGVGSHSTRIGALMKNIYIENNIFEGCRDWCIQLLSYTDTYINNNTFKNCSSGIIIYPVDSGNINHMIDINDNVTTTLQHCKNINVINNSFIGVKTKQVIYSYGREDIGNEHINVTGNKIINANNTTGIIMLYKVKNGSVSSNEIENVGQIGISCSESAYITIDNNKLVNINGYCAIRYFNSSTEGVITGNIIDKVTGHGIEMSETSHNNIVSENIIRSVNGNGTDEYENHGIYIHTDCRYLLISNNVLRTLPGYVYYHAIRLTETATLFSVNNNIAQKGKHSEKYFYPNSSENTGNNL